LPVVSIAAVILNFSSSISSGRGATTLVLLHNPTERSNVEWDWESEEATSSTLHLQHQLSQPNGMVAWPCKVMKPICIELSTQVFSASVTDGFPPEQISLDFV
jgi:hypothetical protein